MPSSKGPVSAAAVVILGLFPKTIRSAVLDDREFSERFAISSDAILQLQGSDVSFPRSTLLSAVRYWMSNPGIQCEVRSADGREWILTVDEVGSAAPIVVSGDIRLGLPDFSCLHADRDVRLKWFEAECSKFELADPARNRWREVLAARPTSYEEVDEIFEDFRLTPIYVDGAIGYHLTGATLELHKLVPLDLRYYERLVGAVGSATTLKDFVEQTASPRIQLSSGEINSVRRLLALGAHSSLSRLVDLAALSREDRQTLFEWLQDEGDPISQLAAIESGVVALGRAPELAAPIANLARQFTEDTPDDAEGRLSLLCGLVVMVDGVLAQRGIGRRKPPFWRRLAAFTHAAVLHRRMVEARVKVSEIREWAVRSVGEYHYVQSLLDLPTEPRWLPEFLTPPQLKAEFVGRIVFALGAADQLHTSPELVALRDGDGGLKSMLEFPASYLPGPIEGGATSQLEMPEDVRTAVEEDLQAETLTANSFTALINASLIFSVSGEVSRFAAEALRRVKYQVRQIPDGDIAFSLLVGLSVVAAVTRSDELASEIRVLGRVLRRRSGSSVAVADLVKVAHVAAAAYKEFDRWSQFLGDWLTELALDELKDDETSRLYRRVSVLCQLEPRLWSRCARAEAALSSLMQS